MKQKQIKKMDGVLPFLLLKLMENMQLQLKTNQYCKIFPERIEIFLQKYVDHIIIKQTQ